MSSARISDRLRQKVASRAERLCEYCLIHEEDAYVGLQVDHIISKKHGGQTTAQNLALACACCNRQKGTDISAMDPASGVFVALCNPRKSLWREFNHGEIGMFGVLGRSPVKTFAPSAVSRIYQSVG